VATDAFAVHVDLGRVRHLVLTSGPAIRHAHADPRRGWFSLSGTAAGAFAAVRDKGIPDAIPNPLYSWDAPGKEARAGFREATFRKEGQLGSPLLFLVRRVTPSAPAAKARC
jgi:hypothetical protein